TLATLRGPRSSIARAAIAVILLTIRAGADEPRASPWSALAPGLWYRSWRLEVEDGPSPDGHVFRADPRVVHMTVLDARRSDRTIARVARLRDEAQAYLVVNGGFFDEKAQPLGLVV